MSPWLDEGRLLDADVAFAKRPEAAMVPLEVALWST